MIVADPRYVAAGFSKSLGFVPTPPPGTSEGIVTGLMLLATGTLSTMFVLRVLKHEKDGLWRAVGFAAMAGSAVGALHGLARILSEFIPPKTASTP